MAFHSCFGQYSYPCVATFSAASLSETRKMVLAFLMHFIFLVVGVGVAD